MSGSDPSTRVVAGPGGAAADDCPGAPFTTVLGSPDPEVVDGLAVDDLLDVVSVDEPARAVTAVTLDGLTVGAITRDIARLRRCIAQGNVYEADVLRVNGGSVTVMVRPA